MARVELEKVTKHYGSVVAVADFDLTIEDGEFVVFVGPSGCGKSTTLRMIAGLESITGGTLSIGGRDVTNMPPKDRNVAMVFQNYALYPHKTVFENLGFGLKVRGHKRDEIDERVKAAAEVLGITPLLARKPKALSGGQMQRVALGRALVRDPEVFLLDEPLSNLDAKMRVRMREEIARLHRKVSTSMIYVTHDQVEAMTLGDRIVVMKDGYIQQVGAPVELYDHPANTFVAGFIGSPEMNLLQGRVQSSSGEPVFVCDDISLPLGGVPEAAKLVTDQKVTVGLRPEHMSYEPLANAGSAAGIQVVVGLVEQMGSQTAIQTNAGDNPLTALLSRNDTVRPGDTGVLSISPKNVHLFDFESGASLHRTGSPAAQAVA